MNITITLDNINYCNGCDFNSKNPNKLCKRNYQISSAEATLHLSDNNIDWEWHLKYTRPAQCKEDNGE